MAALEHILDAYIDVDVIVAVVAEECMKSTCNRSFVVDRCQDGLALIDNVLSTDHSGRRRISLVVIKEFLYQSATILSKKTETITTPKPPVKPPMTKQPIQDSTSRQKAIEDMSIQQKTISFGDIFGLNEAKHILREAVIYPISYPQFFKGNLKPWRRILLYGPPGTGKTCLAFAVALEFKSKFYSISSSDLISSLFGETEKMIKALFQQARSQKDNCMVFIDEVDSLCRKRKSGEEEHVRRVKTELLRQMEGNCANAGDNDKLVLVCATNCPWDLDTAFLRRFQRRIYIPLPDRCARKEIIRKAICSQEVEMSSTFMERLVDLTEGFSGSDICTAVSDALFQPIRHAEKATTWLILPGGKMTPCSPTTPNATKRRLQDIPSQLVQFPKVTGVDLRLALMKASSTVAQEEIQKFKNFTTEFGTCGT